MSLSLSVCICVCVCLSVSRCVFVSECVCICVCKCRLNNPGYQTGEGFISTDPDEKLEPPNQHTHPNNLRDYLTQIINRDSRGKFPGPEQHPGPQLPQLHGAAQIALDLAQNVPGLPVQPLRVGEKFVVDDVLLGSEAQRGALLRPPHGETSLHAAADPGFPPLPAGLELG